MKIGWIEKDGSRVWASTCNLGHLFVIWVALIPGQKGVKQCRGTRRECRELALAA